MQSICNFPSYQDFLRAYLSSLPNSGRGHSSRIAKALHIHSTLFSQILRGHRHFTPEQAALFCDFAGLSDLETELFLAMVDYERAGHSSLRQKVKKRMEDIKQQFQEVKNRVRKPSKKLQEEERAIFYSHWHYSAIRMLCSLPGPWDIETLARSLNTNNKRVRKLVDFLCTTGLLVETEEGLRVGEATTHIEAESPWAQKHHQNWRIKNLNRLDSVSNEELCFTAPFCCSKSDFKKIRESLISTIESISEVVKETEPEKSYVICIDLLDMLRHSEVEAP